jgi:hypothetical protein
MVQHVLVLLVVATWQVLGLVWWRGEGEGRAPECSQMGLRSCPTLGARWEQTLARSRAQTRRP